MDLLHHNQCAHCQVLQSDHLQTTSGRAAVPQTAVETSLVTQLQTLKMLWCNMSQIMIRENVLCDNKKVFCLLHEMSQNKINENYTVV